MYKFLLATLTTAYLAAPVAALAQDVPSYAAQQYADDQNIHGRILSFDGGYDVDVRDERGYVDYVRLHRGTVINPTGLTLAPGMVVSILGYNGGSVFLANEIDTPYRFANEAFSYGGHPWNYYGPSVSLGFFFGNNPGWWHGNEFHGGYGYVRGARVYQNVHVTNVYHASQGAFQGRNYVAPAEHGGYYGVHAQNVHRAGAAQQRDTHAGERHSRQGKE